MKASRAIPTVAFWVAATLPAMGQQSTNCFLTDFVPKNAIVPPFEDVEKITAGTTLYVNVDAADTLTRVSKYIFGNSVAVWVSANQNNPTLVSHLKQLAPTIIRFPGGSWSDIYFWNGNPGDLPDSIPDGQNNGAMIAFYSQLGSNHALTPDQYYAMRQELNAQGLITVNYGYARYGRGDRPAERAAHLAADWVRYDNGRTRFWEIGNENGGPWEAGWEIDTTKNKDGQPRIITGELYGKHFRIFADSMRAAAAQVGVTIFIGGQVLHYDGTSSWNVADQHWNEGFFREAGDSPDFYVMHNYFRANYSTNALTLLNFANSEVPANADFIRTDVAGKGAPSKPVALTEYNLGTSVATQEASFIKGMQAVLLFGELAKNSFGLGARWLVASWETDGMFYYGSSGSIPVWNPRPEFFYAYYTQKFMGDHIVSASVPGTTQIVAYASTFASGHLGVIVVNKGRTTNTASLIPANYAFGDRFYTYTLKGGTDNGDFSSQVYVNDEGPNSPDWGPPIATLDSLKAYAYPTTGNEIKFSIPPRSVEFILVEPGSHVITGVERDRPGVVRTSELEQNYPNPFNPATVIGYVIRGARGWGPGISYVRLAVYDLLGREVAVLVNENEAPGEYEVTFNAARLASGVYTYRLQVRPLDLGSGAGDVVQSKKMIVLR
jgi:hypothetical protein